MTKAAFSLFCFAVYLLVLGCWLLLAPDSLLRIFRIDEPGGLWLRVVGMLLLILGFYYHAVARAELTAFFQWTVYARSSVILFFAAFVLTGLAPPILLLFGAVDLAAAGWTHLSLASDRRQPG